MATSKRVGNYATSANAVIRNSDAMFDAAMSGKPDFTKISKEAIKGRSMERRAVTKAEGEVASAGLEAFTKAKRTQNAADTAKEINAIKRPAKRMAGVVAGLGAISGAAMMHKNLKEDKAERASFRAEQDAITAKTNDMFAETQRMQTEMMATLQSGLKDTSSTSPKINGSEPVNSGSTPVSAPTAPTSSSSKGGNPRMKYMQQLTSQGMSPTQAAATVGHLVVETGNFKYMEELVPNRHGTKGYGHLQWTDPTPGRGRRTDYMNWSKSQGLDPNSFEANSGFLTHELTTNFNNSWTGGGNYDGFRQTGSMEDASSYLRSNYIRPSAGSENRRINEGYRVLDEWNKFNT